MSLDADDGKLVWKFDKDKYRPTFSSPAVAGKYLVVGEGLHETYDARVFCLDVEQSEKQREGVKLWEYRDQKPRGVVALHRRGHGFCGRRRRRPVLFQAGAPARRQPGPVAFARRCSIATASPSPVYLDGKLYFTLGRGYRFRGENAQAIVCVEAKTGQRNLAH